MILDRDLQGKGLGSHLLDLAKEQEKELNGWVVDHDRDVKRDGTPYRSPVNFYLKNDFLIIADERLETEHLSTVKIQWRRQD